MRDSAAPTPDTGGPISVALAMVFALLIGGAIGFVASFTHSVSAPFGLLIGVVLIAATAVGFRLVFLSRMIGGAGGLGAFLGIFAATLPGAGGRLVGFSTPLDILWLCAPIAVTVAVVALPLHVLPRRRQSGTGVTE